MKRALRILVWLASLLFSLLVIVTVASLGFNAATASDGEPVSSLWQGRFVEADGIPTAFREWGSDGPPVVLIGGFMEPTFVWEKAAPLLAQTHRVYALDLDGFGYTERRGPWTLAEWGDQVESFMHELGIRRPIVVGHSLGAAVAVELARRGVASRIVLLNGDALEIGGAPRPVRAVVRHTPFATSALRIATRWDWPAKVLLANAYGPDHPPLDHSVVRRWTNQLQAVGAEHALETMAGRPLPGFPRETLQKLDVQATVVWGAEDNVDSVGAGRQTARDLRAPFVLVPKVGHLSMLSDPAAVVRAIEGS